MSKTTKKRLINLEKYIQNKWDEYYWNYIMKYEDKLDWNHISRNPNITIEIIEKYPNKPWNWGKYGISRNPNITIEIIEKYLDKSWKWSVILDKSRMSAFEFIDKHLDKYDDLTFISDNKFTKEKELFYQKYYRIYLATFKLQQYFNRMYDNPKYLFCRNRLDRLFSEVS